MLQVKSLRDDNQPGSLRYAVQLSAAKAPARTIIFRVSGTIQLRSPLTLGRSNMTIAGQTAPGGGICLADAWETAHQLNPKNAADRAKTGLVATLCWKCI